MHLDELRRLLRVGPVMSQAHVLTPVALDPGVRIEPRADLVAAELDSPAPGVPVPILIQETEPRWANRFATWQDPGLPTAEELDRYLPRRLDYMRTGTLSQARAGAELARRFLAGRYDCGVLLLVDGLSYLECADWPEAPEPCFVDGPSVTEFGFLQIVQASGLVPQLTAAGRYQLRAYSYWERTRNDLAARMFAGVPLTGVRHFPEVIARLQAEPLTGQFVFIVREGLDELAHRQRELPQSLRAAAVRAVREDLEVLVELARGRGRRTLVALLADHGVAWRDDRSWRVVGSWDQSWHGRFSERPPTTPGLATALGGADPPVYCYHPGLLCREPRSNEAGFHGGLSAKESFVPFVLVEV